MSKERDVAASNRRHINLLCISLLIILIAAAYSNTLKAPFIFDDQVNIVDNMSIRHIWPPWSAFHVSPDTGITGRPFINFTLAVNYAISGDHVWSYHALNIIIHILAALTLWGIIRRTLANADKFDRYGASGTAWIALCCALLWALHPLQTQAVTYLSQRCESLMGLFFLMIFYCAIRGWQSTAHKRSWHLLAILSFILGAGCKEVIAAAPVLLFLFDWVFNKNSLKATFKSSSLLYAGLASGLVAEFLLIAAGGTSAAATDNHPFTLTGYWLTQPPVILHYIRLVFWPSSLVLDYGMDFTGMIETWPSLFIVIVLIIVSLWLLLKRKPAGFLMAWFFIILAPTSLYPLPDVAFEHRMYLPSIAIIILIISDLYKLGLFTSERFIPGADAQQAFLEKASQYTLLLLVLALAISTYTRNLYYQTDVSIWADNVIKRPLNGRAQNNLGNALYKAGKPVDALRHLQQGIHLMESQHAKVPPRAMVTAYINMGLTYLKLGEWKTAEYYLRKSLQIESNNVSTRTRARAHTNLGIALSMLGKNDEARLHFRQALSLDPDYADGHANYGVFAYMRGNPKDAVEHFQKALDLQPGHRDANYGMGMVMYQQRRYREARIYFQNVVAVKTNDVDARNMLIELDKAERPSGDH